MAGGCLHIHGEAALPSICPGGKARQLATTSHVQERQWAQRRCDCRYRHRLRGCARNCGGCWVLACNTQGAIRVERCRSSTTGSLHTLLWRGSRTSITSRNIAGGGPFCTCRAGAFIGGVDELNKKIWEHNIKKKTSLLSEKNIFSIKVHKQHRYLYR